MYAYATKYQQEGCECKQIFLIYPKTESIEKIDASYCFKRVGLDNDVPLNIVFFDLNEMCMIKMEKLKVQNRAVICQFIEQNYQSIDNSFH